MSPTDIPTSQPASNGPTHVVVDQETAETVKRIQRVKTFTKSTFKNVGVPVLIGSAAAFVATRRKDRENELDSESTDNATDE